MSIPFEGIMMRFCRRRAMPLSSVALQTRVPKIPGSRSQAGLGEAETTFSTRFYKSELACISLVE
jgi:hypothetical protein